MKFVLLNVERREKTLDCFFFVFISFLSTRLQNAEASDEDEEGTALVITPGPSSAKEEKENEAFFKKVEFYLKHCANQPAGRMQDPLAYL